MVDQPPAVILIIKISRFGVSLNVNTMILMHGNNHDDDVGHGI